MTRPLILRFFDRLKWIDGRPLLDTIEPYRRELFVKAFHETRADGLPAYNLVLAGRGKKNWKSADLVLGALYSLLIKESHHGNDGLIAGNDEDQAAQDLALAKKLILANPTELAPELECLTSEIRRRDGRGSLQILAARNVIGQHGKTALFIGYDEVHGYRSWDLFEALAPDPTRTDVLQWITTYDTIFNRPGIPLFDLKKAARAGEDDRMLFSWYSGTFSTDPALADAEPEVRANPSMASWPEGRAYLDQQKRRLPAHKYRRLHLNLPGVQSGAFLDPDNLNSAVIPNRRTVPPSPDHRYVGFVDMSGGSSDDATLGIAHKRQDGVAVVDAVLAQLGPPPFNPRDAVKRFAGILKEYRVSKVVGDNYAGTTFKHDFEALGIRYESCPVPKTELYEQFEPKLNAGEIELPDIPKLTDQLQGLVVRGSRVDHLPGEHDDWAKAAAGAVWCAAVKRATATAAMGHYSTAW
ncbi:hypothetical protein [Pseudorhodoplanes sp.]|uniref:hypothetical protein n=1 Tax=Pseudorhodoplanes sp. TaxID=1934341 RepID=UPI002C3F907F|nr:hypothetical protein [Pseudorhodoplanes sp.]HWV41314.1 hypothetical protein [Pseudorhodoplanes sp.]